MSTSMSGGPSRSGERNRSNSRPEVDGVGVGDAEGVTDRRVGRRPPPLAEDVVAPAELDDVPHDEEVAGEAELLDHVQLVVDLGVGAGVPGARPRARTAATAPSSVSWRSQLISVWPRRGRERRQVGRDQPEVEGALAGQLGGPLDHAGVAGEAPALLGAAAQVGGGRRPAASRRSRRGCAGPGPRPGRWPAGAGPGRGSGRCWWRPASAPARTASAARASLRAESSGSPWSHSSTATLSRPKSALSRRSSAAAAAGPVGRAGPRAPRPCGSR